MASLLQISLHMLRLSQDNLQRKIEEQQRTMQKPDKAAYEYATNTMNPPPSVKNCKELDGGAIGLSSLKLS